MLAAEFELCPDIIHCFSCKFTLSFSPDVIDRLSFLRGQGMTAMYSWSTKRYISILSPQRVCSNEIKRSVL